MEFRVLGRLEVESEGRLVALGGGGVRALLATFLLHPNELLSSERLADELWGETPPRTARAAIHNRVSHLRKLLGSDRIERTDGGYLLRIGSDELDSLRFRSRVAEASGLPAAARVAALDGALDLWRDVLLPEFAFESLCRVEIAQLEQERFSALVDRAEAEIELGRHAEVLPELERLRALDTLNERVRASLMLALYRCGRTADAANEYAEACDALGAVGLTPGVSLTALHRAILRNDPDLASESSNAPLRLLERVVAMVPVSDRERGESLYRLAFGLSRMGEEERSQALREEALRLAEADDDPALAARLSVEAALQDFFARRLSLSAALDRVEHSITVLKRQGDDEGLAAALHRWSSLTREAGSADEALAAAHRAADYSGRTRGRWLGVQVSGATARALAYGTTPGDQALMACRALPAEHADTFGTAGGTSILLAEAGRFGEARARCARALDRLHALGAMPLAGWFAFFSGWVEVLAGDLTEAERQLRCGCGLLESLGETPRGSYPHARLAHVLSLEGHVDEAALIIERVAAWPAEDEPMLRLLTLQTLAHIHLSRACLAEAEHAAREAVSVVEPTDWLSARGDAALTHATVAAAQTNHVLARAQATRAHALYRQKENVVGMSHATRLVSRQP